MTNVKELELDLALFTGGSDDRFRHSLNRNFLYSVGVQHLAQEAGAYWLVNEIAIANMFSRPVKAEEFQVWILQRTETGNAATLRCEDGNGNIVWSKDIEFTDFPLNSIKLYFENGLLSLPQER